MEKETANPIFDQTTFFLLAKNLKTEYYSTD